MSVHTENTIASEEELFEELVFDTKRVIGVSWVVRSDWHDHLLAAGVVPVKRFVGAISKHPHRRLLWRLLTLSQFRCDRDL
jgi:hypothetical protein